MVSDEGACRIWWAGGVRVAVQVDHVGRHVVGQVEQRRWYGFWDYGDVMHTYDPRRHQWRYDVGGFAWDNSELSTDIWLWHYFLHSGRADVFRLAEAMTRHTGEVDVHHIGPFAPLGTRHGVQHWGDSAKQLRIATAVNRRYYYYLTGDERVGDLMREHDGQRIPAIVFTKGGTEAINIVAAGSVAERTEPAPHDTFCAVIGNCRRILGEIATQFWRRWHQQLMCIYTELNTIFFIEYLCINSTQTQVGRYKVFLRSITCIPDF